MSQVEKDKQQISRNKNTKLKHVKVNQRNYNLCDKAKSLVSPNPSGTDALFYGSHPCSVQSAHEIG